MASLPLGESARLEDRCPLCEAGPDEDHGYIYIGDGWAEVVYRRLGFVVTRDGKEYSWHPTEEEAEDAIADQRKWDERQRASAERVGQLEHFPAPCEYHIHTETFEEVKRG